jgi:hypothetical protein
VPFAAAHIPACRVRAGKLETDGHLAGNSLQPLMSGSKNMDRFVQAGIVRHPSSFRMR